MLKKPGFWIAVGILVVIIVLFMLPRWSKENQEFMARLEQAGVSCLANGHQNLSQHIHQHLTITVNGAAEVIPANTGIRTTCMAELHTHDTSGEIHLETIEASKQYTLGQFLIVYGKPYDRPGYTATLTVNSQPSSAGASLVLEDHQEIVLQYAKQ